MREKRERMAPMPTNRVERRARNKLIPSAGRRLFKSVHCHFGWDAPFGDDGHCFINLSTRGDSWLSGHVSVHRVGKLRIEHTWR